MPPIGVQVCTHRSTLRPASANSEYAVIMLAKAVAMVTSCLYSYFASTEEATAAVSNSLSLLYERAIDGHAPTVVGDCRP